LQNVSPTENPVLFVSDKNGGAEVVYSFERVGLAHFCLELHSSKHKQQVVAELKR